MGKEIKIIDIAKKMANYYGYTIKDKENPNGDIEIKIIGLKSGEKLNEELHLSKELKKTNHKYINISNENIIPIDKIDEIIENIKEIITQNRVEDLKNYININVEK